MKTNTLILIGVIAGLVIISSQLRPQKMSFYKENNNYVIDNGYIIKDVKKISEADLSAMLELQNTYKGRLIKSFVLQKKIKNYIHQGCFDILTNDWKKYGDLRAKLDDILGKYRPQELGQNYYSIQNNQIVTSAKLLKAKDIASLDKMTIRGANEYSICPDFQGKLTKRIMLYKSVRGNASIDPKVNLKLNEILANYK